MRLTYFIEGNLGTKLHKVSCSPLNPLENTRNRFRFKMKFKFPVFLNSYQTELNPSKIA